MVLIAMEAGPGGRGGTWLLCVPCWVDGLQPMSGKKAKASSADASMAPDGRTRRRSG